MRLEVWMEELDRKLREAWAELYCRGGVKAAEAALRAFCEVIRFLVRDRHGTVELNAKDGVLADHIRVTSIVNTRINR